MVLSLATTSLKTVGICLCSPHCLDTPGRGAAHAEHAHGRAFRAYSRLCTVLAALLTLASLFTLCVDSADFEVAGGDRRLHQLLLALHDLGVHPRVARPRRRPAPPAHRPPALPGPLQAHVAARRRAEPIPARHGLLHFRLDMMFTMSLLCTILGLVALVILQSCVSLVPPLPPVPRLIYAPPPAEGELDPLAGSRTLRFALVLLFQSPALVCCGIPFAALSAIHFALNTHGIYLMRCLKRSLELAGDDLEGRWRRPWGSRSPVDVIVKQHQHILDMLHTNNNIFARPITERLAITYILLGLTAYCLSTCGSVQEAVWRCEWETAGRQAHKKLILLTARVQRYSLDGLAAAGLQERISMTTFAQVMKSSVSFLQALRNFH
ncbi:uncharacterized protein LOC127749317 isoform X3 [Frankliniella occidentalis]|uniref:Uncharacterized protein LOC127749317 isoform X3 n=1 Tax=Frankliniella occidentalis TaxID=133901 RepID=A0A9C6U869_FRAOC|nr:uncharacterized protein LOC127749317 isoform X3 [Frankliniella occidentalis]